MVSNGRDQDLPIRTGRDVDHPLQVHPHEVHGMQLGSRARLQRWRAARLCVGAAGGCDAWVGVSCQWWWSIVLPSALVPSCHVGGLACSCTGLFSSGRAVFGTGPSAFPPATRVA